MNRGQNPRLELYDLCEKLLNNHTGVNADGSVIVRGEDILEIKDCMERCDQYSEESRRGYIRWCKERGQYP